MGFNFPNSPSLGQSYTPSGGYQYVWDGTAWRVLETPQLFATAQTRNRIVNGAMQISQELGDAGTPVFNNYVVDQWQHGGSVAGSTTTTLRTPSAIAPSGNKYGLASTISPGKPSLAAGDLYYVCQAIEGGRVLDFRYGNADARKAVLRFAIYTSVAGTYCVSIRNAAADRSGIFEFTVAAGEINQWVVKSVVITGDITGTWLTTTGIGMLVAITYAAGTSWQGVAGWQAGNKMRTASQANSMAVTNAFTYVSDVGLYLDPDNTGLAPKWQMPDEAEELQACQRYWHKATSLWVTPASSYWLYFFKATMRTAPAVTGGGAGFTAGQMTADYGQPFQTTAANQNLLFNARM